MLEPKNENCFFKDDLIINSVPYSFFFLESSDILSLLQLCLLFTNQICILCVFEQVKKLVSIFFLIWKKMDVDY